MHIHLTYHILIHMLIHISYISFTHAYTYLILTYHIMFHFLSSFIYILCHFTLCFLFLSQCTCHHVAVLCFSYHFISCHLSYSNHLYILVICFYVSCLHIPQKLIRETIRTRRCCNQCTRQRTIRAWRRCYRCTRQ